MTWVLFLLLFTPNSVELKTVPFETEELCTKAARTLVLGVSYPEGHAPVATCLLMNREDAQDAGS